MQLSSVIEVVYSNKLVQIQKKKKIAKLTCCSATLLLKLPESATANKKFKKKKKIEIFENNLS